MNLRIAGFVVVVLSGIALLVWFMWPSESSKRITIELPGLVGGPRFEAEIKPRAVYQGSDVLPPTRNTDDQGHTRICAVRELVNVALEKPVARIPSIVLEPDRAADQVAWYLRESVEKGYFPSNLVDGDLDTMAYPAWWIADYVVDLHESFQIQEVAVVWGGYGQSRDYISSWKIYVQEHSGFSRGAASSGVWELYASGDFPNSAVTVINKTVTAGRFRIVAISVNPETQLLRNWIGIQEFQACARI